MAISRLSTGKSWYKYFQYEEGRDNPSEVRNVMLIVSTLIAAVTFQAGVNPPGGVWQDNEDGHVAGRAIYASHSAVYDVFLIANTLALSASILVIISLTHKFPFHFEVIVATVAMIVTYSCAIFSVTPKEYVSFRYVMAAAAMPYVFRALIQLFNKIFKKDREEIKCVLPEMSVEN
ncbi:hypothetical protein PTKIN_Ptkin15bG0012700 [Pterospermum kingtungense]